MKKTLCSFMLTVLFTVVLSINVFAMTAAERDLYNHQYYPQSVNNGGINYIAISDNPNDGSC